ncbi:methylated-DNA--[protein]-cysteine S-methyltransferase [Frankia sp. AgB32]|uniref:methylated-DNA--[protein]-cysteine S-methyltransferase n=1 Tax=Frankia sp. AgB32 TaxID=631119 RepID=UPI00200D7913|nr:methylated-DNA--[protein]-cysteine S-methyltransferase [Frankia sp. AgB32]MCK9893032.1 methylated-DNA--[protein]-cysteine S-methyltransferase [Frankia sp. AgB32]
MAETGMTLFDTAVGRCGVAWSDAGLVAVALPAASDAATRALLRRYLATRAHATGPEITDGGDDSRPAEVAVAIARMVELLDGVPDDLADVRVDLSGAPEFHRRVYEVTRSIPPGGTLTYGEVAARLGMPGAAQAVGQALGRNPVPIVVPCHRVLAAGGAMHGFSAPGGIETKRRMLVIEGAIAPPPPTLF